MSKGKTQNINTMNEKINILFLTPSLTWGGLERIIYLLTKKIDKSQFNISIVYWKNQNYFADTIQNFGVEVIRIDAYVWSFKFIFRLLKIVRNKNIQIIHSWFPDEDLIAVIIKLLLSGKIYLVSGMHTPFFTKKIHTIRYRIISKLFEKIICCSENYRNLILRKCRLPPTKVIAIPNSIEIENFPQKPSLETILELKSNFNIKTDLITILFVGRLSREKGIDILLKAFALLKKNNNNIQLTIVGDGPEKKYLINLTHELNISNNTIFTGFLENKTIYYVGDIFVLPSREESFGLVLLEAMMAGLPICATAVGGINDIIEDGKNGILVKPNDYEDLANGIERLLNMDKQQLINLQENAKKKVLENFSSHKMIEGYEKVYKDILRG